MRFVLLYIKNSTPIYMSVEKMVEPRRIELLSENRSANLSTRLVKSFEIPFLLSGSQDRSPVVLLCVDGYRTLTENIGC